MSHPTRVLYVLNSSPGGATQGIVELIKGLDRDKYMPYIITPDKPRDSQLVTFDRLGVTWDVIRMGWWDRKYRMPAWKRAAFAFSMGMRTWFGAKPVSALCRKIKEWNIDLVHTSTALTLDGALAARLAKKPHIWHVRERIGQRGLFRFWLPDPLLVRTFDTLADWIVPMSRFAGSVFFEQNRTRKVQVIYDGIDCTVYGLPEAGPELRRALGIAPNQVLVAMVANLGGTMKRHQLFIEMAKLVSSQYPNARFAVFGAVPTGSSRIHNAGTRYAVHLQRLVQELDLGERFIWAGFHEDIPEVMGALDVLVHPCEIEGFGRIAIEAMAAHRPVVGPSSGGISESVVSGCTGFLVEPGHVGAFADATMRLLSSPELRGTMGAQARSHVEKKFRIEHHVQQVTSLYEASVAR